MPMTAARTPSRASRPGRAARRWSAVAVAALVPHARRAGAGRARLRCWSRRARGVSRDAPGGRPLLQRHRRGGRPVLCCGAGRLAGRPRGRRARRAIAGESISERAEGDLERWSVMVEQGTRRSARRTGAAATACGWPPPTPRTAAGPSSHSSASPGPRSCTASRGAATWQPSCSRWTARCSAPACSLAGRTATTTGSTCASSTRTTARTTPRPSETQQPLWITRSGTDDVRCRPEVAPAGVHRLPVRAGRPHA